jgi:hypothetical protein
MCWHICTYICLAKKRRTKEKDTYTLPEYTITTTIITAVMTVTSKRHHGVGSVSSNQTVATQPVNSVVTAVTAALAMTARAGCGPLHRPT